MLRQLIVNGALLLLTNSIALHTLLSIGSGPFYIVTVAVAAFSDPRDYQVQVVAQVLWY